MHKIFTSSMAASLLCVATLVGTSPTLAQEKCYADAKKEITDWTDLNDDELISYAEQMEKARAEGKNPADIWINYNGEEMPLNIAYALVRAKYGRASRPVIEQAVDKARSCAQDVQLPRAAYDVAREYLGLTTVLPEAATRVDFAEIKAGNYLGGSDALVPKALEDARKTTEKAVEDLGNATGEALEDARRTVEKAVEDLGRVADPRNW